ncbi:MAG: transcriptional repressor [Candidatus Nomurabacteria bacterium]|jgi:Fe2+ or Zn2+ uptake regulation protein|nr:transcriptional repressor [Candidatus Nomurabacteria bacterium]
MLLQISRNKDMEMQNNLIKRYETILKAGGARSTMQKRKVFAYLLVTNRPVLTATIADSIPSINRSTAYRIIDSFTKLDIVKTVPRGFKTMYELSDSFKHHHHHITCARCNKSVEIHSAELEKLIAEITWQANMAPTGHHIELYGICEGCRRFTERSGKCT